MAREVILVPKVIIDDLPESLYLTIGLWTPDLRIFVNDSELTQDCLKTMLAVSCTRLISTMCSELESIICHDLFDGNPFHLVPSVGSSHEVCKCLGSLIRENFDIDYTSSIIDDSCPIFLLIWILSFYILHLVKVYMYQFSCHSLLIAYDTCFSFYLPQKTRLFLGI